jgi:phenylacetate-CoA ligase
MRNYLLEHIILKLADFVLGTNFISNLQQYRKQHLLSTAQIQQLQKEKLESLITHATTTIPYYKKLQIKKQEDVYATIKKFPILYKQTVTENKEDLYINKTEKLIVERSSGSSGIQGEIFMSKKESTQYQAAQTSLWEWSGYKIGEPLLQTGITPKRGILKTVKDFLFNTQYINAYNINESIAVRQLKKAQKKKVKFFGGYASSLFVYANIAIKHQINLPLQGVISWGDKLFDHYKTAINKAFSNPTITELYGTTEGFVISATNSEGFHQQLMQQTYLEIVDANGNEVADGEMGYVLVTRLDAFTFPLIRYYLGDLAIKAKVNNQTNNEKPYPIIEKIVGRDTDIIQTPKGKFLIVHFFTGIFEHTPQIQQFRVLQTALDYIEIEYIPNHNFTINCLHQLENLMHTKANEKFSIKWKQVSEIPPTASGKPQLIQNLLAQRKINEA